jgi:hypothetical protein
MITPQNGWCLFKLLLVAILSPLETADRDPMAARLKGNSRCSSRCLQGKRDWWKKRWFANILLKTKPFVGTSLSQWLDPSQFFNI